MNISVTDLLHNYWTNNHVPLHCVCDYTGQNKYLYEIDIDNLLEKSTIGAYVEQ